ncbi:hypothetical protein DCAR_0309981 [Daucus carota subsp. sativus]|uniref:Uncharacterized protein n=1 Tax=Daucus carota subsp. sativus TaxID=79200 RepID=A0A165ZIQ8_DAUCS|nr:hypothetical protein DCAR_0309981 [Daucus carota subsp. sativus]
MAMKSLSTILMKSFSLVFVIMVLLTGSQLRVVECRALRGTRANGCDQAGEGAGLIGVTQFGVASDDNSSTDGSNGGSAMRSLMFKLASGPSRKGKGH